MNEDRRAFKVIAKPQKAAASARVFTFSFNNIPVVDQEMERRMVAAARQSQPGRHYPVIIEAPDT